MQVAKEDRMHLLDVTGAALHREDLPTQLVLRFAARPHPPSTWWEERETLGGTPADVADALERLARRPRQKT